jgi:hypothetical protein
MKNNGEHTDREKKVERTEEIEIQPLRGKRPKGVVGEMKPRQAIDTIRRAQREGSLEDDEACWRELAPYLRDYNPNEDDA